MKKIDVSAYRNRSANAKESAVTSSAADTAVETVEVGEEKREFEEVSQIDREGGEEHAGMNVEEWDGLDRMPNCPCPQPDCDGKGTTIMMLHKIPFFRELILASFSCDKCGERNNEVTFGGEIQPKGRKITLVVTDTKDLSRQLIKSDSASIVLPEIEFEIPPKTQKGEISTIEGVLTQAANNLGLHQRERMEQMPDVGVKVAMIIMQLRKFASGESFPFTLILDDIAGNSFLENPGAPVADPNMTQEDYRRSKEQDLSLGLSEEIAGHSDVNIDDSNNYDGLLDKFGSETPAADDNEKEENEENRLGYDEAIKIPSPCPNCSTMGVCNTAMTSIPHFKEVMLISFHCTQCAYKTTEVKAAGAIPTFGTQLTLHVKGPEDLKRDVLKGDNASISIPELDLELAQGSLGGVYTTMEGLMNKVYTNLRDNNPFAMGDSANLHHSNDESTSKQKFKDYLTKLRKYANGEIFPFTLVLRDPMGNSFISAPLGSHLPPEADEHLDIEDYTRTYEEDDDIGLVHMNTKDFETGYEHEDESAVVLPDRLTHPSIKGSDHPSPFAQALPDNTPNGTFRGSSSVEITASTTTVEEEEGPFYEKPPEGFSAAKTMAGGMDDEELFYQESQTSGGDSGNTPWELSIDLAEYRRRRFDDDNKLEFTAHEEWAGRREGMVFRLGSQGLGYYADAKKVSLENSTYFKGLQSE